MLRNEAVHFRSAYQEWVLGGGGRWLKVLSLLGVNGLACVVYLMGLAPEQGAWMWFFGCMWVVFSILGLAGSAFEAISDGFYFFSKKTAVLKLSKELGVHWQELLNAGSEWPLSARNMEMFDE